MTEDIKKKIDEAMIEAAKCHQRVVDMRNLIQYFEKNPFNMQINLDNTSVLRQLEAQEKEAYRKVVMLKYDNCNHFWAESNLSSNSEQPRFCIMCGLKFSRHTDNELMNVSPEKAAAISFLNSKGLRNYNIFLSYTKKHGTVLDKKFNPQICPRIMEKALSLYSHKTDEEIVKEFIEMYDIEVRHPAPQVRRFKGIR